MRHLDKDFRAVMDFVLVETLVNYFGPDSMNCIYVHV